MIAARRERGSATIEFIWLTLLLLVPLVYVMVAVFDTQRAAYGVSAASQSAAQAFVRSPDVVTAERRARTAAQLALDDHGLPAATVTIACLPSTADCLAPGSKVRVLVRTTQPLPLTPAVLGDQVGAITVDSTHTETYGTYREGR
ncbi:hypothetical protein HMPREF0063_12007 [Aeromicrobium marinum DSM 15272]|uniref:TadE-like protein n=1 Tax=Aeromicrobium marinum DSM 15272 TaxID=585531 RepID=E2SE71_9ACTN|nr:hypothetical protein [Aeromicrobium marinum]EFQ82798.1 hypothetical protein HMPREF0063_12007 [Aeromicrobium marinum DSM 15272]